MKRIILISVILAAILSSSCAASVTTPSSTPNQPAATPTAPAEQPATSPTLALLKTDLETFLTYNKFQQLDKMWSMLHPDIQGIYGDVDEFIKNMRMRPNLKGWVIGSPQIVSQWACKSTEDLVGTEKTYSNVAEIPVTFIYSTTSGEIEQSQMMNAIVVNNDWKFFIRKIKASISESTITPTPTPTPLPGYSRSNPVGIGVPLTITVNSVGRAGTEYNVRVTLLEAIRGDAAWQRILAQNQFNSPPKTGYEYILAKVRFEYLTGPTPDTTYRISSVWFNAVSASGKDYNRASASVEPEPAIGATLYPGALHEGRIIFEVAQDDTSPLLTLGRKYDGTDGIWFKLYSDSAQATAPMPTIPLTTTVISSKAELESFLNANFSSVETSLGVTKFTFEVGCNDYITEPYDYKIKVGYDTSFFALLSISNKISTEMANKVADELRAHQENLARAVIALMPNTKLIGGYYSDYWEYPTIHVNLHVSTYCSWANFAPTKFMTYYADAKITDFVWTPDSLLWPGQKDGKLGR